MRWVNAHLKDKVLQFSKLDFFPQLLPLELAHSFGCLCLQNRSFLVLFLFDQFLMMAFNRLLVPARLLCTVSSEAGVKKLSHGLPVRFHIGRSFFHEAIQQDHTSVVA